jgi:hypothetical protein
VTMGKSSIHDHKVCRQTHGRPDKNNIFIRVISSDYSWSIMVRKIKGNLFIVPLALIIFVLLLAIGYMLLKSTDVYPGAYPHETPQYNVTALTVFEPDVELIPMVLSDDANATEHTMPTFRSGFHDIIYDQASDTWEMRYKDKFSQAYYPGSYSNDTLIRYTPDASISGNDISIDFGLYNTMGVDLSEVNLTIDIRLTTKTNESYDEVVLINRSSILIHDLKDGEYREVRVTGQLEKPTAGYADYMIEWITLRTPESMVAYNGTIVKQKFWKINTNGSIDECPMEDNNLPRGDAEFVIATPEQTVRKGPYNT